MMRITIEDADHPYLLAAVALYKQTLDADAANVPGSLRPMFEDIQRGADRLADNIVSAVRA